MQDHVPRIPGTLQITFAVLAAQPSAHSLRSSSLPSLLQHTGRLIVAMTGMYLFELKNDGAFCQLCWYFLIRVVLGCRCGLFANTVCWQMIFPKASSCKIPLICFEGFPSGLTTFRHSQSEFPITPQVLPAWKLPCSGKEPIWRRLVQNNKFGLQHSVSLIFLCTISNSGRSSLPTTGGCRRLRFTLLTIFPNTYSGIGAKVKAIE